MSVRVNIFQVAFISAFILIPATPITPANAEFDKNTVISNYADIAHAVYEDSLITVKTLDNRIKALVARPGDDTLILAKEAWLAARIPYQQSEVFRFGNAIVDDWEGRVNSWPLDEGLIDYVDASYGADSDENSLYTANVIANSSIIINGNKVDASIIEPEFLANKLHEAGGIEANVATGYHAIEFLLWGQDLNKTKSQKGARKYTDYDVTNCSNGNCDRRAQYLIAASALLVSDLSEMVDNWTQNGKARLALTKDTPDIGLSKMLTGMGSLSYGELAGERMKLGLLLHDPEEEHDCFSDNTHNSHYYDALGIRNVYLGQYTRINGNNISGPSLSMLVGARHKELDMEMQTRLDNSVGAMEKIVKRAETIEAYDQMIGEENDEGNAIVQAAIDSLIHQTKTIEKIIGAFGLGSIELEGSQSLDDANAVFK